MKVIPQEKLPGWKLAKADWDTFSQLCKQHLTLSNFEENNHTVEHFTDTLLKIAHRSIPKTSSKPKKPSKPWFNDTCKAAVNERKNSLKKFIHNPTTENLSNYKIQRAVTRRTIREAKC